MNEFESVGVDIKWQGQILTVGVERFRQLDDGEVSREKVWHPGAVGCSRSTSSYVWLTRQPREAVGERSSLEMPAGKLDVEGESRVAGRRARAVGGDRQAGGQLGGADVVLHQPRVQRRAHLAVPGHRPEDDPDGHPDEGELIEVVPWPRDRSTRRSPSAVTRSR